MLERKLNAIMSLGEFESFKQVLDVGEEDKILEHIQLYIDSYPEHALNSDDVLSLALIKAIDSDFPKYVKRILSLPHEGNILATVNGEEFSPISLFLLLYYTTEMMDPIASYLKESKTRVSKINLEGDTFLSMHSAAHTTLSDFMTVVDNISYFREHFLQYIYTKKSLDQLESIFVQNFYVDEYVARGHEDFFREWRSESDVQTSDAVKYDFCQPDDAVLEQKKRSSQCSQMDVATSSTDEEKPLGNSNTSNKTDDLHSYTNRVSPSRQITPASVRSSTSDRGMFCK